MSKGHFFLPFWIKKKCPFVFFEKQIVLDRSKYRDPGWNWWKYRNTVEKVTRLPSPAKVWNPVIPLIFCRNTVIPAKNWSNPVVPSNRKYPWWKEPIYFSPWVFPIFKYKIPMVKSRLVLSQHVKYLKPSHIDHQLK